MAEIKAGAIEKGMFLLEKGAVVIVAEREFVNPGKGAAFARLKLKNIRTGQVLRETRKTQETVQEIDVEDVSSQYLYSDGESYHFMVEETFDQYAVPIKGLEDRQYFLMEGESYKVIRWGEESLDIKLPPKIDLVVTQAAEGVKGDTVTGATKVVTLETGLEVRVPIFIKEGEKVRINVETKEYQERING